MRKFLRMKIMRLLSEFEVKSAKTIIFYQSIGRPKALNIIFNYGNSLKGAIYKKNYKAFNILD